jgi:rare lipoprotein A
MNKIVLTGFFGLLLVCKVEAEPKKEVNASWYEKGKKTASGENYDPDGLTAAHPTFAFGTVLRVTNPKTGKVITVIVNDRGPFIKNRQLDLSRGSAIALGFFHTGTAKLLIENLGKLKKDKQ